MFLISLTFVHKKHAFHLKSLTFNHLNSVTLSFFLFLSLSKFILNMRLLYFFLPCKFPAFRSISDHLWHSYLCTCIHTHICMSLANWSLHQHQLIYPWRMQSLYPLSSHYGFLECLIKYLKLCWYEFTALILDCRFLGIKGDALLAQCCICCNTMPGTW